eukprot:jgi/Bigna1/61532/fgenesh1_kg.23_\
MRRVCSFIVHPFAFKRLRTCVPTRMLTGMIAQSHDMCQGGGILGTRKRRVWARPLATMATITKPASSESSKQNPPTVVFSSKRLRSCRMIRKMIKEIFGHPNVPAEGEVVRSLPPHKDMIVALVPEDKGLDVSKLRLSYPTQPITEDEAGDMMMYTAARVRIDHSLLLYYPHAYDHLMVD